MDLASLTFRWVPTLDAAARLPSATALPNAQLIIYPDSNHGAHHQYPELFVEHATLFLNA